MKLSDVLRAWEAAYNARDADALAALYHDDAIAVQVAVGVPLHGPAAVRAEHEQFFANIPDNFTKIHNMLVDGDRIAIEWTGGGTYQPTQKPFDFRGCGFFELKDGKIWRQTGYWDMVMWQRAIGV
jgi:steroid delta-isomerase-like uncharacterized protein